MTKLATGFISVFYSLLRKMRKELFNETNGASSLHSLRLAFPLPIVFILMCNGLIHCCLQAPTALCAAACACPHACLSPTRPARTASCVHCPVPGTGVTPTWQEHRGKLNVRLLLGQLPNPEPEIQLHSGVNPSSLAAFQGSGAALPSLPSPFSLSQRLWYDLGLHR